MIERPIPQDILKYKQKAIGNFSGREIVFGGLGLGIFAYDFFLLMPEFFDKFQITNTSMQALIALLPAMPFIAIGFITIYGVSIEKIIIPLIMDNFCCPPIRRKEIHYKEFEEFEQSRKWVAKGKKITCKKSKQYKGIR